ncbi:hypothetical protein [Mesorhizobium sp. M0019]|uniref:hypothetical protein n=1 Tax=unclassified Mesorhizobium TaxID=325217 RepID=UPI00333891D3
MDALIQHRRAASLERLQAVVDARNKACLALLGLRGFPELEPTPTPGLVALVQDAGK